MPAKTKTPQPETKEVQGRDLFQTPNYAVDLLVPFLPETDFIWECASGDGKIVNRLTNKGFTVFASDIRKSSYNNQYNFLTGERPHLFNFYSGNYSIVTNPPFSLKRKFYNKCREYNVPFALLIPADYSGWIIQACIDGAEKVIPTRRIDYITPNVLSRIHEGEMFSKLIKETSPERLPSNITLERIKEDFGGMWATFSNSHIDYRNYSNINDVPQELLSKYSSSDFHSMWLTWGFNLGKTETFVELTNEQKRNNI